MLEEGMGHLISTNFCFMFSLRLSKCRVNCGRATSVRLSDGKPQSAVDAVLDGIENRLRHRRERGRGDRFVRWNGAKDRMRNFGLRLQFSRFCVDGLRLTELVRDRLGGTKERFERAQDVLELFFAELERVELSDDLVEVGMRYFERCQIRIAIDL